MNRIRLVGVSVFVLALAFASDLAAQGARLQFDHLDKLAERASETVDVNVDPATLQQSAGFLAGQPNAKAVIDGIKAIYVKSFKFDAIDAYSESDVEDIRKQLAVPGWQRVVGVREKDKLSEVYFWREGGENGGLAILVAEPKELTVVNIVGRIDLATLAGMGKLIPKLPGAPKLLK